MPEEIDKPTEVQSYGPNVLERFIGQQHAVDQVKVALEACWNDGTAFPATLMIGPPGLGKTQLVKIIAAELGSVLHEALSQTLESPADLNALLLGAADRDVVFLDEADFLDKDNQVLLYRAIEERRLFMGRQGGKVAGSMPLANVSVCCASNNEFSLVAPLRERFKLVLRFDFYAPEHLSLIVQERATALRWRCAQEVFPRIAAPWPWRPPTSHQALGDMPQDGPQREQHQHHAGPL